MPNIERDPDNPAGLVIRAGDRETYMCQSIPGSRWDPKRRVLTAPLSWGTWLALNGIFGQPGMDIGPGFAQWTRDEYDRRVNPSMYLRNKIDDTGLTGPYTDALHQWEGNLTHGKALYPHQRSGALFLAKSERALLADEMGLGKTLTSIAGLGVLHRLGHEIFPVLMVVPNSTKGQWRDHWNDWWPGLRVSVVDGHAPARREALESEADVYIIHWQAMMLHSRLAPYGSVRLLRCGEHPGGDPDLKLSRCEVHEKELNRIKFRSVVVDECVTADALVTTPSGRVPISTLNEGDRVLGVDHRTGEMVWSIVRAVIQTPMRETIAFGDTRITPDHPVWRSFDGSLFYDAGYEASSDSLRVLSEDIQAPYIDATVLFEGVPVKNDQSDSGISADSTRKYEPSARYATRTETTSGSSDKRNKPVSRSEYSSAINRVEPPKRLERSYRWERSGSYEAAGAVVGGARIGLGYGVRDRDETSTCWVPDALQGEHRECGSDVRYRGGREITHDETRTGSRCEEAGVSGISRVDDHTRSEQGSSDESLWNLETSSGNYFVNGILVHNCHRMKDVRAKQTRATWAVQHQDSVRFRFSLSGTPLADHPGDLWPIMHGLAPEEYPRRRSFEERYCLTSWSPFGGMDIVGINPTHRAEFFGFFDPRFRRMPKALVAVHLPPITYERRDCAMSPKQAKAYREIEQEMMTRTEEGDLILATNNLAVSIRLVQFASAFAKVENDKVILSEPSPKLDLLEELVEDAGKPLVACAESRQLIELASERLTKKKIPHHCLVGGLTSDQRTAMLKDLDEGRIKVLLFTMQAGGEGLNMTAADTIVRLQRSWSMMLNVQTLARVHRLGSERHDNIVVVDIVTPGTIEERQFRVFREKMARLQEIARDRDLLRASGRLAELAALEAEEQAILNSSLL